MRVMKQIDNRQNKLIQLKAGMKPFPPPGAGAADQPQSSLAAELHKGGAVLGLVSNILFATKIAQAAKHCHLSVHNFDRAQPLVEHAKEKPPLLVILDWDGCEAEAYKVLKEIQANADLKTVAAIGYRTNPT